MGRPITRGAHTEGSMTHPLFTLLSERSETSKESPQAASGTSLTDLPSVSAGTQQAKRGAAEASAAVGVAVGRQQVGYGVAEPGYGWPVPGSAQPGLAILAIQDPGGRTDFAPGLTVAERREILFDLEWFDVRVRRRLAVASGSCEGDGVSPPSGG